MFKPINVNILILPTHLHKPSISNAKSNANIQLTLLIILINFLSSNKHRISRNFFMNNANLWDYLLYVIIKRLGQVLNVFQTYFGLVSSSSIRSHRMFETNNGFPIAHSMKNGDSVFPGL